jgi:hypothetical protein
MCRARGGRCNGRVGVGRTTERSLRALSGGRRRPLIGPGTSERSGPATPGAGFGEGAFARGEECLCRYLAPASRGLREQCSRYILLLSIRAVNRPTATCPTRCGAGQGRYGSSSWYGLTRHTRATRPALTCDGTGDAG